MKSYDKTGGQAGKPAYRTPAWFKNGGGKKGGFKARFRKPSV
ncbi:MAG: hypothetical protein AAB505_01455 [Patescibacteria group bacterium]